MKIICTKRLIHIYSFLLLTSYFSLIFAQAPDTLWTKTYGGIYWDGGQSVQQTSDSGYIIAGNTTSFSGNPQITNVYLIKTDVNGDTMWTKTYEGSDYANGLSVQQTSDDGYIIAGYTMAIGSYNWDVYLIKTDVNGDTIWTRIYGGDTTDIAYSVQQTIDQGYIVAGYTKSFGMGNSNDVWLLKTDSLGDTVWTKTYGGINDDYGCSVQQTPDHGYIVVGYTFSWGADSGDIYLVKTDSLGDTLWTQTYGGVVTEIGNFVQQTLDNGYIIVGNKGSYGAENFDVYLIKTDVNGDTIWTRTYGGALHDYGWEVREISNEGYVIAGHTKSFSGGEPEVYILRTELNGDTLWTKIIGGGSQDEVFSIALTSDAGYIIAGRTMSFGAGMSDVYLIKTAPDTLGIVEHKISSMKITGFGTTIISGPSLLPEDKNYKVFDITGRVVMPDKIKPGIYFIEIEGIIKQKIIKIR